MQEMWAFSEMSYGVLLEICFHTRDSRGRSTLMKATIKQYLQEETMVSNFLANLCNSIAWQKLGQKLKTSLQAPSRVLDLALYMEDRQIAHQSLLDGDVRKLIIYYFMLVFRTYISIGEGYKEI